MNVKAGALLGALALAAPALAQTKATELKAEVKTEKLWKIEVSGISG